MNSISPNAYKISLLFYCLLFSINTTVMAQGNYVPANAEVASYGIVDLGTAVNWSTDRSASPGFFSGVGTAVYSGFTDANNIDGYVKHYVQAVNQGFTFPVGTGTDLRTLTTSGVISNGLVCGTAWIPGDPSTTTDPTDAAVHSRTSLGAGILSVSPVGQWDWVDFSNNSAGISITVSIPDMTAFALASDLRLVGWNGSMWVNLSGVNGASGVVENSTLSGTMISGISALGIGAVGFPLPIALDSFVTHISSDCIVELSWHAGYEKDVCCFDIQRSSDGFYFTSIGSVQSNGYGHYSFSDANVKNGEYYYRVKTVDKNSDFYYSSLSKIVSLTCSDNFWVDCYPIPSSNQINVEFSNTVKGYINIVIIDNTGRVVNNINQLLNGNYGYIPIDITALSIGTYKILINSNAGCKSFTIVKN